MAASSVTPYLLAEVGENPNNAVLPLLFYKAAVRIDARDPEGSLEKIFSSNNWGDGFRGDTFPFHHYHSFAHEVVGCARGQATLQFGGPTGPVVDVEAGDAVLIPAGVVHCRLDDRPGYVSIGAYPPGQKADICVLLESEADMARAHPGSKGLALKVVGKAELPAIKAMIARTVLPETDPIGGKNGAVQAHWLKR